MLPCPLTHWELDTIAYSSWNHSGLVSTVCAYDQKVTCSNPARVSAVHPFSKKCFVPVIYFTLPSCNIWSCFRGTLLM